MTMTSPASLSAPVRCFLLSTALVLVAFARAAAPSAPDTTAYKKLTLAKEFFCEGAAFGDFNKDGQLDVVSGPYWYAGPDFTKRHELFTPFVFDPLKYSDNFFAFAHDFNADGWPDVLVLGFPGVDASWYQNPGAKGGPWRRYVAALPVDNESPTFGQLLAKGPPSIVCMSAGRLGYFTPEPKDPARPWTFRAVSPVMPGWQRFTHGLGFGDVNGDGRNDILEKDGWWEQPASLAGDPVWKRHTFPFSAKGGAQMVVMDVNADGVPDVITSKAAHGYGLSWFEQVRAVDGGGSSFKEHVILAEKPEEKVGGVQFSQLHALALSDVDGDGLPDIVTGKRWWAHGPTGDADPSGTPVLYALLLRRGANHTATYEPRLLEATTGVGTQLVAADVNGDGRPDFVVGNKRGTAVLLSQKK